MAYKFNFDLGKIPEDFFEEIECFLNDEEERNVTEFAEILVKKYDIDTLTTLTSDDARKLIEDLIDIQLNNKILRDHFQKGDSKALFLPHCCRKYMDSNCKATFNPETSSFTCSHCSKDCMVSQATDYAKLKGYDVYVLPGASCVGKIFKKHTYDAIIGVACTDEIKMASESLLKLSIPSQAIPLLKNGCASTFFSIRSLMKIIA